jgi:flagellar hook-basal body complex protein FliE
VDISSYGNAMSKLAPGTFVPDVAPGGPVSTPLDQATVSADNGGASFKDTLAGMIGGVNDALITAQQKSTDYALGKTNDTEGVIKSVEEAGLSFQMTMAIRNKLLQAYTEISQMQF